MSNEVSMEQRPDLPQLESVEARYEPSQIDTSRYSNRSLAYTFIILVVVEQLLDSIQGLQPLRYYNHLVALASSLIFVLDYGFLRVYRFRTDRDGLTAHKLFWRNSIRWSNVTNVKVKISPMSKQPVGYVIVTCHGGMWLPVPLALGRSYALLIGSIWQHLRRFGRLGPFALPEQLEDLWWSVPESAPREADWKNAYPPVWRSLRSLLYLKAAAWLVVLGLGVWFLGWHKGRVVLVLMTLLVGAVWGFLWYCLSKDRIVAVSARADSDGIEADTGFGRKHFRWRQVRRADWSLTESAALNLSGPGGRISVPNQSSAHDLLLVVLRNLRALEKFETIGVPKDVRSHAYVKA